MVTREVDLYISRENSSGTARPQGKRSVSLVEPSTEFRPGCRIVFGNPPRMCRVDHISPDGEKIWAVEVEVE